MQARPAAHHYSAVKSADESRTMHTSASSPAAFGLSDFVDGTSIPEDQERKLAIRLLSQSTVVEACFIRFRKQQSARWHRRRAHADDTHSLLGNIS